jgi:hypothetical protein
MKNIFKTFKENKKLSEENKLLRAQNEALTEFRKNFDNYYADISGVKIICRDYDKQLVLSATFSLNNETLYCPIDVCKEEIVKKISKQLLPLVDFIVVDDPKHMTKDIVGRLTILKK